MSKALYRYRWLIVLGLLLLSAVDLWARAGGGHSSSSGGGGSSSSSHSSSSGGSGGGDGLFELVRLLWWLNIHHPLIGLPVTGGLLYVAWRTFSSGKKGYQGVVIKRGAVAAARNLFEPGLRQLREADPEFVPEAFQGRVRVAFEKLQKAWCDQSLVSVRPFISDGIHERFHLQFEEQRALGYRPVMERLSIAGTDFAQVECGPVFDVITVRFAANAQDYRVDAATGRKIAGSDEASFFVEYWSFIRTRGSQTKRNQAGLIEGHCPNCGAAIAMNQGAKCEHCQALLRSGEYDWVLAEITQQEEWRPRGTPPPGTVRIRERDAGFNVQDLEDVASVIFWRKAAAEREGRIDALLKVAAPAWCKSFASTLDASVPRKLLADYSVSAVDTVGLLLDEHEHRALVQVWWMARNFTLEKSGRLRGPESGWLLRSSLFVLSRKAAAQSLPGTAISSAHCPECGAPMRQDTSNACEYCGTVLNDGTRQWVLHEVFPASSGEARALISETVQQSQRNNEQFRAIGSPVRAGGTAALAWAVRSLKDGGSEIDGDLRGMLAVAGKRRGLDRDQIDAVIASADEGTLDLPAPTNGAEAQSWIAEMAMAAHLTNGISRSEEKLLRKTGSRLGLTNADLSLILNRARSEAYAQAREELKAAKREKARSREDITRAGSY